jgi:hypothetical protein
MQKTTVMMVVNVVNGYDIYIVSICFHMEVTTIHSITVKVCGAAE